MTTRADVGTGTTVEFLGSGFAGELTDVAWTGISKQQYDATHLESEPATAPAFGSREYIFSKLVDGGQVRCSGHFDPDEVPPIEGVVEAIRVTFPVPAGKTTGAMFDFQAAVTDLEISIGEGIMTFAFTLKVTGSVTPTASA